MYQLVSLFGSVSTSLFQEWVSRKSERNCHTLKSYRRMSLPLRAGAQLVKDQCHLGTQKQMNFQRSVDGKGTQFLLLEVQLAALRAALCVFQQVHCKVCTEVCAYMFYVHSLVCAFVQCVYMHLRVGLMQVRSWYPAGWMDAWMDRWINLYKDAWVNQVPKLYHFTTGRAENHIDISTQADDLATKLQC